MARFVVVTSPELQKKLGAGKRDLPAVYMMSPETEGFARYHGEIVEMSLSEWILRNSSPSMAELTVATSEGMLLFLYVILSLYLMFICNRRIICQSFLFLTQIKIHPIPLSYYGGNYFSTKLLGKYCSTIQRRSDLFLSHPIRSS